MTLSIRSLNKGYGITSPVLFDISFELEKGSITGVLGKNGIGKSTLLRSIAQLEPIQNGKIFWDGNPLKKRTMFRLFYFQITTIRIRQSKPL
ncbi:ATP-binding cassette domain-containing protein [Candidatus Enterococcus murrayae]|uniref:ATP-binding cassette domain-containing protein n=1 Tax=Candidatus Enterococcus murrayae TaxID=2815321 RepID=UPI003241BD60